MLLCIFIAVREGLYNSLFKHIYDKTLKNYLMRKFEELRDLLEEKSRELRDKAMELARNIREAIREIIEWIRSRDPVSPFVKTLLVVGNHALFLLYFFLSE